ncbi:MAG: acetyltransferase [Pseudomonadota bacterium]
MLMRHAVSTVSITAISLNLLFWFVPLLATAVVQFLARTDRVHRFCHQMAEWIYRSAAGFDNFWLGRVLGIDVRVYGDAPDRRDRSLIVVSNHRSWFDILVLQGVIVSRGPMLKFLIKRELVWVPIVGWICLALSFPRLVRGKSVDGRLADYEAVATASADLKRAPAALMNFAEGTRFSPEKRDRSGADYQYTLNPRSGGLRIMLETLPEADILDATLVYPDEDISFWRCLSGDIRTIEVDLATFRAQDVGDVNDWLRQRWLEKEKRIRNHHAPVPLV